MNKNKPVLVGIIELSTIGEELLAEMSPGNLNLSNKIGYCTIEVWPDEGQIPHFHIITKNKIKWECCIEIFRPRYFSHGSKQGTLSNKQLKILDDWLREEEDNESTGGWKVSIYKPDGTSYHSISFDRISKYFDKRYDFLWYDGCVV